MPEVRTHSLVTVTEQAFLFFCHTARLVSTTIGASAFLPHHEIDLIANFQTVQTFFRLFLSTLFRSIRKESSSQLTNETYFESLKLCFFK